MLITIVASVLFLLTPLTLRGADPELAAALIVFLTMLTAIGTGASVAVQSPDERRR
jgi:hypothetical protein